MYNEILILMVEILLIITIMVSNARRIMLEYMDVNLEVQKKLMKHVEYID